MKTLEILPEVDPYAMLLKAGDRRHSPTTTPTTEEGTPELCQACGGIVSRETPAVTAFGYVVRVAADPSEARKLSGECIPGECARERTIGRDADGNIHHNVAPATKIAFLGAPRRARFAR